MTVELARVKDEAIIKVANNKIRNFGIVLIKTDKGIGQMRTEISIN